MVTRLNAYNLKSTVLSQIPTSTFPRISEIVYREGATSVALAGGEVVTIYGSGFASGVQVTVGNKPASVVVLVSSTELQVTTPSNTKGNHWLTITNTDGTSARFFTGIQYSGSPDWSTAAGNIGSFYETTTSSFTFSATSDTTVTYTVISGSLPSGISLNQSTGQLTGTFPVTSVSTQYNFEIKATDVENEYTSRNFSLTVLPDSVTWVTPTLNQTLTYQTNQLASLTLSATSGSGNSITYSVTGLPSGLTYSAGVISGTPSALGSYSVTITATISTTNRTSNNQITISIVPGPGQSAYTTPGTYSWVAPAGVTSVCVVCVGGGGSTGQTGTCGGGGGGLAWKNNITVVPGNSYTVVVGAGGTQNATTIEAARGGDSYFINQYSTVNGFGGTGSITSPSWPGGSVSVGGAGGVYLGDGGGNGGDGGGAALQYGDMYTGGGGGAGGYSGRGGHGQQGYLEGVTSANQNPAVGSGGGGGGGAGGLGDTNGNGNFGGSGGGGGGVGIYGQGTDGVAGVNGVGLATAGNGATGGSGGTNGTNGTGGFIAACNGGSGGGFGGGAASGVNAGSSGAVAGTAGGGAVRIIWGTGRSFPSTNTGDM